MNQGLRCPPACIGRAGVPFSPWDVDSCPYPALGAPSRPEGGAGPLGSGPGSCPSLALPACAALARSSRPLWIPSSPLAASGALLLQAEAVSVVSSPDPGKRECGMIIILQDRVSLHIPGRPRTHFHSPVSALSARIIRLCDLTWQECEIIGPGI